MASNSRVVWAVDLQEEPAEQRRMLDFLKRWTGGKLSLVEPVYAARGGGMWPGLEERRMGRLLEGWYSRLAGAEKSRLGKLRVLQAEDSSLRARVGALLDHAEKAGVSAVALTTKARRGLPRWAFGSFTEAALLSARVPLLTLNPDADPPRALKRLLFATDLGKASDAALERVIAEAKARGMALTLAYCAEFERAHPEALFDSGAVYERERAEYQARARQRLEEKAQRARFHGLTVDTAFLRSRTGVARALTREARRRGADVIALLGRSGSVRAALGGSVTRQVVRISDRPVWALRPS